ncbi:TolC family protein [Bacteroides sedimenti]|uniref:Transporter n=1 Tax=Bacteroides sedimenti TaxID=2136147 RepID=A0ABN6Z4U0_9BACE
MKKIVILFMLLLAASGAKPQADGIGRILKSIEANNKELKASSQLTVSRKLEAKTENNLSDPSVSYSYQFGSPSSLGKASELNVSQEFDFPTLYSRRSELIRLKGDVFDRQEGSLRQQILLSAKQICLDLILLNKQKALYEKWLKLGDEIADLYKQRLELGDANALETNKIQLEQLNARTEYQFNEAQRRGKLLELQALNGNIPVEFSDTIYIAEENITDFASLKQEALSGNAELLSLEREQKVAQQQLAVNKSQWLPKLELGYRRNTGLGQQFNGMIVGFSLPLFENKNKVKQAKAQSVYVDLKKESLSQQTEVRLLQLYKDAQMLRNSMKEYNQSIMETSMPLLSEALRKKQISIVEYSVDAATIFRAHLNYMTLESRYHKVMAELYQHKL